MQTSAAADYYSAKAEIVGPPPGQPAHSVELAYGVNLHRDTSIVHAGYHSRSEAGVFLHGPQFSATYTAPGDPAQHRLTYGRFDNPTWTALEQALGHLDGGQAVCFACVDRRC